MSNQSPNDKPLFQNMDEQEQVFAPEQLPGNADAADQSAGRSDPDYALPGGLPAIPAGSVMGSPTAVGGATNPIGILPPEPEGNEDVDRRDR